MTVFIDTSAFFAVLDRDDANHLKAREQWRGILAHDQVMVTTNYVLVETFALLGTGLGYRQSGHSRRMSRLLSLLNRSGKAPTDQGSAHCSQCRNEGSASSTA
jgi:predicted nucleic acid-binding protein